MDRHPDMPWLAHAALALAIRDRAEVDRALRELEADPGRSLPELLRLSAAETARLQAHLAARRGVLLREVEDQAFARWAVARGLDEAALEAARRVLADHPGGRLWEVVLVSGALQLESTPCLTREPLTCPRGCGVAFELPVPLAPHVQRCPACGAPRSQAAAPAALAAPSPAVGQQQLLDAALATWAASRGVVVDAHGPTALAEALVVDGRLAAADVLQALADERPVTCRGCRATWRLGQGLLPFAASLSCPACGRALPPPGARSEDGGGDATLVASRTLGRWRLVRRLGRGGMGDVWAAEDEAWRRAAVKLHAAPLEDHVARRRFEREVGLLTRLDHPNVVGVHDRGVDASGRPWVALELIQGRDLTALARGRGGRLEPDEVAWALCGALRGVHHLHGEGVLHRDLKPSNVLVTAAGTIKVVDLGVALLAADRATRLTRLGRVVGTVSYVAPEVIDRLAWAPPADLFSLGALAYRLLTGRAPWEGASPAEVFDRRRQEPPPDPAAAAPDAPRALLDVVRGLLEPDPARRLRADAALAALGPLAAGADLSRLLAEAAEGVDDSPAPPLAEVAEGQTFGRYQVLSELGRGGVGVVYEAYDQAARRPVALKVLLAGRTASLEERRRFFREAEAASLLMHPAIVPVLDVGERAGTCYMVLELVQGQSLDRWAQAVDLRARLELFVRACDGVHHAHSRGVIHRDLKPENILVDLDGGPRILDFGIAKRLDQDSLTGEGDLLGTLRYMPPEQAAGRQEEVDARSDVYALGAILYELCSGRTPFTGDARALLHGLRHEDAPPPSRWRPELPAALDAICARALRKAREDRWQSALDLGLEVGYLLGSGAPAGLTSSSSPAAPETPRK